MTTSSTPSLTLRSAGPSSRSAPASAAADEHQRHEAAPAGASIAPRADRDGGQRAGIELSFGADVPEPRPERDGGGKPGQDQRRRPGQGLGQGEDRAGSALRHQAGTPSGSGRRRSASGTAASASATARTPSGARRRKASGASARGSKRITPPRSSPCPAIIRPMRSQRERLDRLGAG